MRFRSSEPKFYGKTKNTIVNHDGSRVEGYGLKVIIPGKGKDIQFEEEKHKERFESNKLDSIRDVLVEFISQTDAIFRNENADYSGETTHFPYYRIGGRLSEHIVHLDMPSEHDGLTSFIDNDGPYIWTEGRGTNFYPGSYCIPSWFSGFALNIAQMPILRLQTLNVQAKELPTRTIAKLAGSTVHSPPYSAGLDPKESAFISNTVRRSS